MKHVLSVKDIYDDLYEILQMTREMEFSLRRESRFSLKGTLLGTLFLEPSTRTRLSFEAAMHRARGRVISVPDEKSSSREKGETMADTVRTISQYVDVLVVRSSLSTLEWGTNMAGCPVINAGDGCDEHPTQALVDAYTIKEHFDSLKGLTIACVGDILKGRTVHSLTMLMSQFKAKIYAYDGDRERSPTASLSQFLKFPETWLLKQEELIELLPKVDILYMTRMQHERGSDGEPPFKLTAELAKRMPEDALILHPLPRRDEIDPAVDGDERAMYFEQAKNGVAVRMALLKYLLCR